MCPKTCPFTISKVMLSLMYARVAVERQRCNNFRQNTPCFEVQTLGHLALLHEGSEEGAVLALLSHVDPGKITPAKGGV